MRTETSKGRKGSPYGDTEYIQYDNAEEVLQSAGVTDKDALLVELANLAVEKGSISKANQAVNAKKDISDEAKVTLFKDTRKGYTIHTFIHGARVTKDDKVQIADALQDALASAEEGKTYTVAELRALMQKARAADKDAEATS